MSPFSFVFFLCFLFYPSPLPRLDTNHGYVKILEWVRDFIYLDFSSFVSHASTVFFSNCCHTFFFFFPLPPELAYSIADLQL